MATQDSCRTRPSMNDESLSANLDTTDPAILIGQVLAGHGRTCMTNSFQAEDMVVLHLLRQYQPDVAVLFLDTGYHFEATYAFRDHMTKRWNLNLTSLRAVQSVAEQESAFGILNRSDPGRCCHLRKVEPLMQ